jgi:hypothetical protein
MTPRAAPAEKFRAACRRASAFKRHLLPTEAAPREGELVDALVMACVSLYIVTGIYVGVRLLRIASRSKRLPEAALGIALFCFAALSQPAAVLEEIARQRGALAFSGVAGIVAWLGTFAAFSGLTVFTWQAFRPTRRWAASLCFACIAVDALAIGGLIASLYSGVVDPAAFGRGIALSCAVFAVVFGWGAVEGVLAFRSARRRHRLGLADAVVKNRFMLWAASSFGGLIADLILVPLVLSGADLTRDAGPRLAVAGAALLNSICWYLAFAPPASYTRWLSMEGART